VTTLATVSGALRPINTVADCGVPINAPIYRTCARSCRAV